MVEKINIAILRYNFDILSIIHIDILETFGKVSVIFIEKVVDMDFILLMKLENKYVINNI